MYVLEFLKDAAKGPDAGAIRVEHRLLCSGELYNRRILTSDWRKSDITRILLREPCELFVASRPFAAYPQELCIRLALREATEHAGEGNVSAMRTFLPDDEVVEDLCSLLSVLSRRLISPYIKTREQHAGIPELLEHDRPYGSYESDLSMPIAANRREAAWKPRPATVLTSFEGQKVIDNAPPPTGADDHALADFLTRLPKAAFAPAIVSASRLYRTALELIETRADIAYQLLVSTVETLASAALAKFEPDDAEKLAAKSEVQRQARVYGLDETQANALALLACKGMGWTKRKFTRFLMDRVSPAEIVTKDAVFMVPEHFCPSADDTEKTLGLIYMARSGNLHGGLGFPVSVGVGTSPYIHFRQMPLHPLTPPEIPPVAWFERVVSIAARKFLLEQVGVAEPPFVQCESPVGDTP
jgi:hypothetical protein